MKKRSLQFKIKALTLAVSSGLVALSCHAALNDSNFYIDNLSQGSIVSNNNVNVLSDDFKMIDTDDDQLVSVEELTAYKLLKASELFATADADTSGSVTKEELDAVITAGGLNLNSELLMADYDTDKDGGITVEEYQTVSAEKAQFEIVYKDVNEDGFLSPQEFSEPLFEDYDTNLDGFVSIEEVANQLYAQQRDFFLAVDANGDKVTTVLEFSNYYQNMMLSKKWCSGVPLNLIQLASEFSVYDGNGDLTATLEEAQAYFGGEGSTRITIQDKDGDKQLNPEEFYVNYADMRLFGEVDVDTDGLITGSELDTYFSQIQLDKYANLDIIADGILSFNEFVWGEQFNFCRSENNTGTIPLPANIMRTFIPFDLDASDTLSTEEIKTIGTNRAIVVMDELDKDGDEAISWDEVFNPTEPEPEEGEGEGEATSQPVIHTKLSIKPSLKIITSGRLAPQSLMTNELNINDVSVE